MRRRRDVYGAECSLFVASFQAHRMRSTDLSSARSANQSESGLSRRGYQLPGSSAAPPSGWPGGFEAVRDKGISRARSFAFFRAVSAEICADCNFSL